MTHFLKPFATLLLFLGSICLDVCAQDIVLSFTNKTLSADMTKWTFDLEAKGGTNYGGPENGQWIAANIRLDLTLPNGVTVVNGSGVGDPTYASASIGVQALVPGDPPPGMHGLGLTIERADANQDLNTSTFVKLGSYTINFSGAATTLIAKPRTINDEFGSSWSNYAGENVYRAFVFADDEIALPVKLIRFEAKREGNVVQSVWSTSEEANSAHFELERSRDGRVWSKVAEVPAKGESNGLVHYSATDKAPMNGKNLYRLKMVDLDGSSAHSRIQIVDFENRSAFFPNPASDELIINAESWVDVKQVSIRDLKGVEVYRSALVPEKRINLRGIRSGAYVVQLLMDNSQVESHPIVIAR